MSALIMLHGFFSLKLLQIIKPVIFYINLHILARTLRWELWGKGSLTVITMLE